VPADARADAADLFKRGTPRLAADSPPEVLAAAPAGREQRRGIRRRRRSAIAAEPESYKQNDYTVHMAKLINPDLFVGSGIFLGADPDPGPRS
jgi:hypothetical protein